jgi:NitT/TauT family transport system permease protein
MAEASRHQAGRSKAFFDSLLLAGVRSIAVLAILLLWELGVRWGRIDPFFFSSPTKVGQALWELFVQGTVYRHLWTTIEEALWGLLLGLIAGALLGWLVAQGRLLAALVEPLMVLLNAIPRIVLAPLFIMWFGIGIGSKIALSFLLVFVVVFFAVYGGIKEVDQRLVERLLLLGGSARDVLIHIYIPSVAAWVFSSLRVTVGFAFTGAVVGEFVGSSKGLGYLLNFAQNTYNATLMIASLVIIVAFILVLFALLERVEERTTPWKKAATG